MPEKYVIGIDIGGTNLRAALISGRGEVIRKIKEPSRVNPPDSRRVNVVESLQKAVGSLFSDDVKGIGIGVAGLVDRKEGVVLCSPNLHCIEGVKFKESLGKQFPVPVLVENDANAAAFGENG